MKLVTKKRQYYLRIISREPKMRQLKFCISIVHFQEDYL